MPILKLALLTGAGACLYVVWASWSAGYPPEIAVTRGVVGFTAMTLLGFVGELTVARARTAVAAPPHPAPPQPTPGDQSEAST